MHLNVGTVVHAHVQRKRDCTDTQQCPHIVRGLKVEECCVIDNVQADNEVQRDAGKGPDAGGEFDDFVPKVDSENERHPNVRRIPCSHEEPTECVDEEEDERPPVHVTEKHVAVMEETKAGLNKQIQN